MTLQNGYSYAYHGGAIYNWGTQTISNCTLTANTAHYSGYISSLLGGKGGAIYNQSGTMTIFNSALSGNNTGDYFNDDTAPFYAGGGIYNESGTVTVENSSSMTWNGAYLGPNLENLGVLYRDGTSTIVILDGNPAISF